ncbi:MAG TPA: ATP-binding protein, partial [Bacteroidales bacterium]|nr:ATP-binding protein [Bacteroidales bacterium]
VLFFVLFSAHVCLQASLQAQTDSHKIADSLRNQLELTDGLTKLETYRALIKSLRNIDPASGIEYARNAMTLAESLGAKKLKAEIRNEKAVCYRKLHIYEKAFALHLESLSDYKQMNDSAGTAVTLANIGQVYFFYKDYEQAIKYHTDALVIKEFLNDEPQIAYSQNALGMVFLEIGNLARALDYFIAALNIYDNYYLPAETANTKANLAKVMFKLHRYDDAMRYLKEVEAVYLQSKADFGLSQVYNQMAEYLFEQGKYEEALNYLSKAKELAEKTTEKNVLLYNYLLSQKIAHARQDYQTAYDNLLLANKLKDTLVNERRHHEMTEIKVRYQTKQLDDENEILRLQLSQQSLRIRYIIFALLATLLALIIFILITIVRRNRRKSRLLEITNLQLEERVEERTRELKKQMTTLDQTYQSLKQSEEKFRKISETSPLGVAVTNAQGNIIFVNNNLTEILGLPKQIFLDGLWFRNILLEDRNKMDIIWKNAHKAKDGVFEAEFRLRLDQQIRYIHFKAATMFNAEEFAGIVSVFEDVSQRKNFENELVEAKNKAEDSDRLKSAFLANMSHEIRTPMNAILGFSDLLSTDEYSPEEKMEFIEMIKSSGKLLLNLINDIIDISKIEAGELKIQTSEFKLIDLMDEMLQGFRQQMDRNGKSHVKLLLTHKEELKSALITTDRLRLQQILTNLLSNAMKFTQVGEIEFGALCINSSYEFFVRDTGIGIPEQKLEVVFERFRQADDSHTRLYGGTGLGLAITKHLVELLNGKIWVESQLDKGTAFYFTLPSDNENKSCKIEEQAPLYPALPSFKGKTVLVAEDVDTNFFLVKTMLKKLNLNVIHASNGLIALDLAVEHQPDLIIMDIQMPEMDGIEAFKQIRHQKLTIPVIAITAFAMLSEEKQYLGLGFDAYLSKPLSLEKLVEILTIFLQPASS